MPALELSIYRNPLDLLCRFAPTPVKATVYFGSSSVLVETNDVSLLPSPPYPSSSLSSPTCAWKLVRDLDNCCQPAEASIIMAGSLIVYSMGPACIIGADREHKQVLAFIGVGIEARFFEQSILPSLCRLTDFVTRPHEEATAVPDPGVAMGERCNA